MKTKNPTAHFRWNKSAFTLVDKTLRREEIRLRAFKRGCPTERAHELANLRDQLKNLLVNNPPNVGKNFRFDEN